MHISYILMNNRNSTESCTSTRKDGFVRLLTDYRLGTSKLTKYINICFRRRRRRKTRQSCDC